MISNYVIVVYVSSDPGTYMVCIQFTFQNQMSQWPGTGPQASLGPTPASRGFGPCTTHRLADRVGPAR
jgi:hypothetical protein